MTSKQGGDIKTTIRKARNTVRKISRVANVAKSVAENPAELFKLRKRVAGVLPPEARQTLEAVGNDKITDIKIVRTPVEKAITGLLNLISLGTYSKAVKQSDYDSMFHLALFINNGIQLDKQAVIKFYRANPIKETSEVYNLPVSGDITFNELIEKTRDYMGADKFSNYDSRRNNCQDFIMGILNANGLNSPEAEAFVKQNADAVFSKMPQFTDKIAKTFTDIGAIADRVIEGESVCQHCRNRKNGYGYTAYQNGECWTVLNQFTGRVIAYCTTEEKAQKQISLLNRMEESEEAMKRADLDKLTIPHPEAVIQDVESNKNIRKELLEKKNKITKSKSTMETWREYYAKHTKGKKFANRAEVNAHMKKLSAEYKAMKSK